MAVAALILGIFSLILSFFPVLYVFTFILGAGGIVLGAIGRKNIGKRGMATTGMILSIIAVAMGFLFLIACAGAAGVSYMM